MLLGKNSSRPVKMLGRGETEGPKAILCMQMQSTNISPVHSVAKQFKMRIDKANPALVSMMPQRMGY